MPIRRANMGKYVYIKSEKLVPVAGKSMMPVDEDLVVVSQMYRYQPYKTGIVYGEVRETGIRIGWSICSDQDEFNKDIGIELATKRFAKKAYVLPGLTAVPHQFKYDVLYAIYEVAYQLFQDLYKNGAEQAEILKLAKALPEPELEVQCADDHDLQLEIYKAHSEMLMRLSDYFTVINLEDAEGLE